MVRYGGTGHRIAAAQRPKVLRPYGGLPDCKTMVGEQKIIKLSLQVRLADRIAAHERDDLHAGGFGVLRCHTAGNGRIQTGSYTDKDGIKRYTTDVVVEEHYFVESKNANNGNASNSQSAPQNNQPAASNDGFMSIPEGIEEELPFI